MYVVYYYHLVIILHSYILPSPILAAWNLGGIPIALERETGIYSIIILLINIMKDIYLIYPQAIPSPVPHPLYFLSNHMERSYTSEL